MRDGWRRALLGRLLQRRTDFTPVVADDEYTILGVQRSGWGFVEREPIKGSDQKFKRLMKVERDNLVYRTITAFEAPSAVAGPSESGKFVTPQTFPVFRIDETQVLASFMRLLTTWPSFHEEMASRCTGSVLRRKTLSISAFESIPIDLPPISEQRRIVDLIGAVDDAIDAAQGEADAAGGVARSMRDELFSSATEWLRVGDVYEVRAGKQLQSKSSEGEFYPYVRAGNIGDGYLDLSLMKEMRFTPGEISRLALRRGDVVVVEGGNGYGKSAVWTSDSGPVGFQNHVLRMRPQRGSEYGTDYVYQWARWCHEQERFKYTGTGIPNLGVGKVRRMKIPIRGTVSTRVMEAIGAADRAAKVTAKHRERLCRVRSNLLDVLLSGEHEIPASYGGLSGVTS